MDYFFEHDLATVFGIVLLQQLGAPIPALPVLMFAGAGAIGHPLHALYALVLSIVASTIGNLAWFWAGRHYGYRVSIYCAAFPSRRIRAWVRAN